MRKTRSELAFERFLAEHEIPFRPIPTGAKKTPDYDVTVAGTEIIFELKEIVSVRSAAASAHCFALDWSIVATSSSSVRAARSSNSSISIRLEDTYERDRRRAH